MPFSEDTTFILHAGAYKTATSTIQTLMMTNRDDILARHGVLYPRTATRRNTGSGNPDSQAHHLLYHVLNDAGAGADPSKIAEQQERLAEEIAAAGTNRVVLNTELFASASIEQKRALVEFLAPARLRILYTLRRPDDYIESMQNQAYKNFRAPSSAAGRVLPTLRNLQDWEAILGREALIVLAFTKNDYPGYLSRVFESLGVPGDDPIIDPDLHDNPAMTLTGLLIRRTIARRLKAQGIEISRDLRHRLNVELDELEKKMPASPKAVFLTRKERRRAMAANADDQVLLAGYMEDEERARFEAELDPEAPSKPRNVSKSLPMDAKTLEILCASFSSGFLGKTLGF